MAEVRRVRRPDPPYLYGPHAQRRHHRVADELVSVVDRACAGRDRNALPKLLTGVSAVTAADAPNIAVGGALGSCVFNLAMLVLLDEPSREEPLYRF